MTIEVIKENNVLIIKPAGRIDSVTAPDFGQKIEENLVDLKDIVFDFDNLDYLSSAGLRVLLSTQKSITKLNGTMKLKNVKDVIKEVFDITGFTSILTIE